MKEKEKLEKEEAIENDVLLKNKRKKWGKIFKAKVSMKKNIKIEEREEKGSQDNLQPFGF